MGGDSRSRSGAAARALRRSAARPTRPVAALVSVALASLVLALPGVAAAAEVVDELHYTFTSDTSVALDWRGPATDIRYGASASYGSTATAGDPTPMPC